MRRFCVIVAAALMVAACAAAGHSRTVRRLTAKPDDNRPGITLLVDSIDCRSDLTRVYARMLGRPNTAQRLDSLRLTAGSAVMEADDIDGVDMRRWFQWDDSGVIDLEIDFAPIGRLPRQMQLRAVTPKGNTIWTIHR